MRALFDFHARRRIRGDDLAGLNMIVILGFRIHDQIRIFQCLLRRRFGLSADIRNCHGQNLFPVADNDLDLGILIYLFIGCGFLLHDLAFFVFVRVGALCNGKSQPFFVKRFRRFFHRHT